MLTALELLVAFSCAIIDGVEVSIVCFVVLTTEVLRGPTGEH